MRNLTSEKLIGLYKQMWTIRLFEERAIRLFGEGLITGSTHPCIGQEAIAVGACAALEPKDLVLATYRGHGQLIAKGGDVKRMMAELLGRQTGYCKGKGGSMHLSDPHIGFLGSNAVVGAHIPIAGGVALSNKLRGTGAVTLCFFGDGASCEGVFFETCNMAALWKVPLVLICENNEYAISVHVSKSISVPDIAMRAQGFGFPGVVVDGNDPIAVYEATAKAVERARDGEGPTLIECKTVRWERHSAISAGRYETPEEAKRWMKVDPIPRFRTYLIEEGMISEESAKLIEEEARQIIEEAVAFAKASPLPPTEIAFEDVFA